MTEPERITELQLQKLILEIEEMKSSATTNRKKRNLEVDDLKNRVGFWGRFSTVLWPVIGSLLTIVLSVLTYRISHQQTKLAKQMDNIEIANKDRETLDRALSAATDNSNSVDRRIAGIWELAGFWSNQQDEKVVASVLSAELILPEDRYRFARCAAAEALGDAIQGKSSYRGGADENRSKRIAKQLYGATDGTLGLVTTANIFLRRSSTNRKEDTAEHCLTPLAATKEAIRKNWEYLRATNLNVVDLSQTELYAADLAGSMLNDTHLEKAIFRCANLFGTSLSGAHYEGADFRLANVSKVTPGDIQDDLIKHYGAIELSDEAWQQWRHNHFQVDDKGRPVLVAGQGTPQLLCKF